jgi:hypothetical protein
MKEISFVEEDRGEEDFEIEVTLPNGVRFKVLIPDAHPYQTSTQPFDMTDQVYGLNFVTDGHYY